MSGPDKAVFLSYASQDAEEARRICEALRATGVEVWFDRNELVGGDQWDAKIRGQIGSCTLFVPLISAATQARREGYFRLEWKLAAQRTHMMSERTTFLLPVVVDATRDADADVPVEFRAVQWTRLSGGAPIETFVERVQRLLEVPDAAAHGAPASGRLTSSGDGKMLVRSKRAVPWRTRAGAVLAVVLLVTAGYFALHKREAARGESSSTPVVGQTPLDSAKAKSIAVLTFANMSAEKDTEYFSDGISEEILNALDRNPALRVTPRTSSFSFKEKNVAIDEIGRALGVTSVIEGSVRKSGNKVRITVKLLNAADGSRVWAEEFDREMTDIFAVQSEIAAKVAQKLSGEAGPSTSPASLPAGAQTKNLAAYDAYLRGRALQTGGFSEPNSNESVRLYEQAVQLDPAYALAWARLAETLARVVSGGYDRSETWAKKARDSAATALRLAPDLPEANLAGAMVALMDRDVQTARHALDRVGLLRPNDSDVLAARALLEHSLGDRSAALSRLALRAVEADPKMETHWC